MCLFTDNIFTAVFVVNHFYSPPCHSFVLALNVCAKPQPLRRVRVGQVLLLMHNGLVRKCCVNRYGGLGRTLLSAEKYWKLAREEWPTWMVSEKAWIQQWIDIAQEERTNQNRTFSLIFSVGLNTFEDTDM